MSTWLYNVFEEAQESIFSRVLQRQCPRNLARNLQVSCFQCNQLEYQVSGPQVQGI